MWRGRTRWLLAALLLASFCASGWALRLELGAIRLYQQIGSPVVGLVVRCRYQPTCSHYALEALEENGLAWGNLMVARRLALCSPLGEILDP